MMTYVFIAIVVAMLAWLVGLSVVTARVVYRRSAGARGDRLRKALAAGFTVGAITVCAPAVMVAAALPLLLVLRAFEAERPHLATPVLPAARVQASGPRAAR
jgi:hypothetical protein